MPKKSFAGTAVLASPYIAWINENVAEEGQDVKGIIIARSVDEALKYAVKGLPHIAVKTYRVDFRLYPFGK